MKKKIFVFVLLFGLSFTNEISAQFRVGIGLEGSLKGKTVAGVQGKLLYDFAENFEGNGSFTYYFGNLLDWSVDLGVQYKLLETDGFRLAPLAGIDITHAGGSTGTSLQVGVFSQLNLEDAPNIYIEPKWVIDRSSGLILSAGVVF